jgi:hypothetical protein
MSGLAVRDTAVATFLSFFFVTAQAKVIRADLPACQGNKSNQPCNVAQALWGALERVSDTVLQGRRQAIQEYLNNVFRLPHILEAPATAMLFDD